MAELSFNRMFEASTCIVHPRWLGLIHTYLPPRLLSTSVFQLFDYLPHPTDQNMEDSVRPSDGVRRCLYERGYRTWFKHYEVALSSAASSPILSLENVIPQHPYFSVGMKLDKTSTAALYATGTSTWSTTEGSCDLPSFKSRCIFGVTTTRPTLISLSTSSPRGFSSWFGDKGDHTAVLTLAWAYVLSARWAEIVPGATVQYTDRQASWLPDGDNTCMGITADGGTAGEDSIAIDLGDVSGAAARWWASVLAPDEGWNACILHNGRKLKSPWSVKFESVQRLTLARHDKSVMPASLNAIPFSTAARYLAHYVTYHGVTDQSQAAFIAALLLPTSQNQMKRISLPLPGPFGKSKSSAPRRQPAGYDCPWGKDDRQLDRLLTLSCNTTGVVSLLSSIFVEPDIPCNVCGAWLQGAFAVLTSDHVKDPHVLAHMLINRSPKLGFLWLGTILIGMDKSVMKWARSAVFLIDLDAAAWTNTLVSFVQARVSKLRQGAGVISRADEARLMYLTQQRPHAPMVPFGPFGTTAIRDCVLEVQIHAQCQGYHGLSYAGWTWDGQNENQQVQYPTETTTMRRKLSSEETDDALLHTTPVSYHGLDHERDCSESQTHNMFVWLRGEDGFPVAERAICEHEWVESWDSDEEEAAPEGDGKSTTSRRLGPWLSRTMTQRCNSL